MKTVVSRIYAILVLLSLVGLAAWGLYDWNERQQIALDRNTTLFKRVAQELTTISTRYGQLPPQALTIVFRNQVLSDPRWKMLLLNSQERGTEYYWGPKSTGLPGKADHEQVVPLPSWKPQPWGDQLVQIRVPVSSKETYLLQGIYSYYGRAETFDFLKICGFFLLGLLILTTLFVLLLGFEDEEAGAKEPQPERTPPPRPFRDEVLEDLPNLRPSHRDEKDEYWFDDTLPSEPQKPQEQQHTPRVTAAHNPEKPDLFSPGTGLSWETFLAKRLDFELERCAGQNQDLSLVLFSGTGLENQSFYQSLGQEVGTYFPFRDLDFEYGTSQFAVVIPNQNLDKTMKEVNEFLRRADKILPQVSLRAGLASRSGRLLSSFNLLKEAELALIRAQNGQERVVGLKTDPDTYRAKLQSVVHS